MPGGAGVSSAWVEAAGISEAAVGAVEAALPPASAWEGWVLALSVAPALEASAVLCAPDASVLAAASGGAGDRLGDGIVKIVICE